MKDNEIYLIYYMILWSLTHAWLPTHRYSNTHRIVISRGLPTTTCLIETEEFDLCLQEIVSIEGL